MTLAPDWHELGLEDEWVLEPELPEDWAESGFDFAATGTDWQEWAVCAQVDPALWFPEKGGSVREAKKVCLDCPAREECLAYALENNEPHGVWGGLSEPEREQVRAGAPVVLVRPPSCRVCKVCEVEKPLSEFHMDRGSFVTTCVPCRQHQQRRRNDAKRGAA